MPQPTINYATDHTGRKLDETDLLDHPLYCHRHNLMQTATGYGSKLATQYKVKHNNRLKRVYCRIYSNSGTLYIMSKGTKLIINA